MTAAIDTLVVLLVLTNLLLLGTNRLNGCIRMVALQGDTIVDIPLMQAVRVLKKVPRNHPLLQSARSIGTSFGD